MKSISCYLLIFLLVIGNVPVLANTTINIGTFEIPYMVQNKDEGLMIDITREVARMVNVDINIIVYPRLRAMHMFLRGDLDAFFPVLDVDLGGNSNCYYFAREYIYKKRLYIHDKGSRLSSK